VEFEPAEEMEEFEEELRRAFERQPAPLGLKGRILARRHKSEGQGHAGLWWQRLAATLALVAVLGGAALRHQREEQRKGEAARQQVLIALRITGHALNQMNRQLAAHGRASQE
jgi:hypothetical protein